jgi:hypothetical protein
MPLFNQKCKYRTSLCGGKIVLFDKALVAALGCGALSICAMWVGDCFKKFAVGKI